jgi:AraC-like DNA-binding protein
MVDPLSEIIRLLSPRAVFAKGISGKGAWGVRYSAFDEPSFCSVLEGSCRLSVDGEDETTLEAGDFVLLPATPGFVMSSFATASPKRIDPKLAPAATEEVRHGESGGRPDVRLLGGAFMFGSPDASLLVSLLPRLIHIKGPGRLSTLVGLVADEARAERAGRDVVLSRLVEVLLVEALRASPSKATPTGLLAGLADSRLAASIRAMHNDPASDWTVVELAKKAALSRSAYFDRFTRTLGIAPTEYLTTWRMALAKDLLRRRELAIDEVAERVGYASASTFSTAFSRHVGKPPGRFARDATANA